MFRLVGMHVDREPDQIGPEADAGHQVETYISVQRPSCFIKTAQVLDEHEAGQGRDDRRRQRDAECQLVCKYSRPDAGFESLCLAQTHRPGVAEHRMSEKNEPGKFVDDE